MPPRLSVNQPVLLTGEGGTFASRVEDVADEQITLARPFGLPLDTQLGDGQTFDVQWTEPTGLYSMPAQVVERSVEGRIRIWHATPTGEPRVSNRRSYIRVPVTLPLTLQIGTEQIQASLLDVSEAAIRCQVPGRLADPNDAEDAEEGAHTLVRLSFMLGEESFDLPGTVFRKTMNGSKTDLVILLPDDEGTSGAVRRAVFGEQIRARQRGV